MSDTLRRLGKLHDLFSRLMFMAAAVILSIMIVSYCYEVVARYFFNAPTIWASPLVSYGLCASIFLALPDLTRRAAHVTVDLHEDLLPPAVGRWCARITYFVSGVACLGTAFITADQTYSEYLFKVWTSTYWPIPKWWLFILIPIGMFSAGVYFFRFTLGDPTVGRSADEVEAKAV